MVVASTRTGRRVEDQPTRVESAVGAVRHRGLLVEKRLGLARPFLNAENITKCGRRLQLADEVRYSIVPVLIGDRIPFLQGLDRDVALHLLEVTAYTSGMVALRYEVRR